MPADSGVVKHTLSRKRYLSSLKLSSVFQQKRTRAYTTLILTFIALIIFSVFAINPTLTTIVQLQKQLEDSKTLDQQLNDKVNALQKLQAQYDQLAPDLPLVESAVPVMPETPTLLAQFQALIKKHNLTLTAIKVEKVPYTKQGIPSGKTASSVNEYQVVGKFSDINEFLADVVNFDRLITIDQVSVGRDSENPTLITATAELKGYFDQAPL